MRFIFMDNYRGFSKEIIPLLPVTFLVGENSTGKSSFLALVNLLSTPKFWFDLDFNSIPSASLGGYKDIVSVASSNKKFFSIGVLFIEDDFSKFAFAIMTFINEDGVPKIRNYINFYDNKLVKIRIYPRSIRRKTVSYDNPSLSFQDKSAFFKFFMDIYDNDPYDNKGYRVFRDVADDMPFAYILTFVDPSPKRRRPKSRNHILSDLPHSSNISWLAPIRTKPHRIYHGLRFSYTPEGDHTPHIIRKMASSKKSASFKKQLADFGNSSGLFLDVKSHSFSKEPESPFEIQVEISGGELNISNVGYGVSQILPVIVEMLIHADKHNFSIQQPEVHLHPKAQAAIGDIVFKMTLNKKHNFIIETHSEYLINRFRYNVKSSKNKVNGCVIFFERSTKGNKTHVLPIDSNGKYASNPPRSFSSFFIHEELRLLEI